jgi:mono/diheme cytochrome c family protein
MLIFSNLQSNKTMIKISVLITGCITSLILFAFSTSTSPLQDAKNGKEVYSLNCQSCHMEKGEGMPGSFPPLAKTNYVKDTKKIIGIILNGQSGEIIVNGKKYNMDMPAQAYLTDQQIADVLTYVRGSWGNKYPAVTAAQVKAERK